MKKQQKEMVKKERSSVFMIVSIAITLIAFIGVMYLMGNMYCELNFKIEELEDKLKEMDNAK